MTVHVDPGDMVEPGGAGARTPPGSARYGQGAV